VTAISAWSAVILEFCDPALKLEVPTIDQQRRQYRRRHRETSWATELAVAGGIPAAFGTLV